MTISGNQYYFSGTSGLLLPVPNKAYYPTEFKEASRLSYYSSLMDTIEINSSFYKIPQASTVKRWSSDVPADFKFTFKLFKEITHSKNLIFNEGLIHQFFEVVNQVDYKKGCILVQFPPSIRIDHFRQIENLLNLLRQQDPALSWKIAVEFRHPSLYVEEVYELLHSYSLGLVIHDKGISSTPIIHQESDFVYLRFHGPGGNYRGSYNDDILHEYSTYISDWITQKKQVYVYFNNTMGNAIANLNTLKEMVKHI